MARETQSLQIALIIFVILTIALGVVSFLMFKSSQEANVRAEQHLKDAAEKSKTTVKVITQSNELKRVIGFAESEEVASVLEHFKGDMKNYASSFPEDKQFYRSALEYMHNVLKEKSAQLADAETQVQELKTRNEMLESTKDSQLQKHAAAVKKAQTDLANITKSFEAARAKMTTHQENVDSRLADARRTFNTKLSEANDQTSVANSKLSKKTTQYDRVKKQLGDVIKETFELADGEIRWINQKNKTVWVNLGSADSLPKQTTFSVYDSDSDDVSRGSKKASIEITQILGDHLAEGRIIEDLVSDPILPGDKIHTPVWSPGDQKHFAIIPFIDIDGDGKGDQHIVRNLIVMSGGVIDAEVSDEGKLTGELTVNTRYIVRGDPPTEKQNEEVRKRYSQILRDANQLGVEQISFRELLNKMGWKNQTSVQKYGIGASEKNFRPLAPDGVQRVSEGNVSGLFKERKPPKRSSKRSAF